MLKPVYITDFERCQPKEALFKGEKKNSWRLCSYKARHIKGTMLIGEVGENLPEIVYPLNLRGWYSIWLGIYKPDQGYCKFQIKLTKDEFFRDITISEYLYEGYQWIEEGLWKYADLTGQKIIISKPLQNRGFLAYIKLIPLSIDEVREYKEDEQQKETKIVGGVIDVGGMLSVSPPFNENVIKRQIQPFIGSDFKKICWGVDNGLRYLYHTRIGEIFGQGQTKFCLPGAKNCADFMATSLRKGFDPLEVAVKYAHQNNLELYADFRLSHAYPLGKFEDNFVDKFYKEHQHLRCISKDGNFVANLSHAYPEINTYKIAILKEIAENYEVDGIYLDFLRFPPYVLYEEPLISGFEKEFGKDPRELSDYNLDWLYYRARYMTEFMRDLRNELREIERKQHRKIELVAQIDCKTVFSSDPECRRIDNNLILGIDIKNWIKENLIDILAPSNSRVYTNISLDHFKSLLKGKGVKLWPVLGQTDLALYPDDYKWNDYFDRIPTKMLPQLDPKRIMRHASDLYNQGTEGLFLWEAGGISSNLVRWQILRRLGHKKELAAEFGTKIGRFDGIPSIKEKRVLFL
mgnify:CR=1 FL=1